MTQQKACSVIDKTTLVKDLERLGLEKGDRVFLHSAFKSLGLDSGKPQDAVDAFIETFGDDGCLGMPVFSYSFSSEEPFDLERSASKVGIIPEFFRKMRGVRRSFTPSHSTAFYGKDAEYFSRGAEFKPPYSFEGPFGKLYDFDFKIVMLGCGLAPNSTIHAIEDWAGLPYMVNGQQTCYSSLDPDSCGRPYSHMPVGHRDFYLDPPDSLNAKYVKLLRERGVLRSGKVGNADAYWMRARELVDLCMEELDANPGLFLCDRPGCASCAAYRTELPSWQNRGGALWGWSRIGRSKVNINPGADSHVNHGYGPGVPCDGILDDIHARVLVFRKKWERFALVSLDLLQMPGDLARKVKRRIAERNHIAEDNISLCCAHNHCGPSIGAKFIWGDSDIRENGYVEVLSQKISAAVFEASQETIPVKMGYAREDVDIGAINRRIRLSDGTYKYYEKPTTLEPNGITDKTFSMIVFKDRADKTVAGIGHYSCHPIFTPPIHRKVTADYPGFFSKTVEDELGEGSVVCFLQGSLGDQMPRHYCSDHRLAVEAGRKLGFCLLNNMNRCQFTPLRSIKWNAIDHKVRNSGGDLNAYLQVLKLNDFTLAFIGGEMFLELGMDFKNRVDRNKSLLVGIANDFLAYIPTREAFDNPTYEVTGSINWIQAKPGIGEELVDACVELAKQS